jgi:hypothetical protein
MASIHRFYHSNTIYSNKFIQIRDFLFDITQKETNIFA